jgi:hypothetical protein
VHFRLLKMYLFGAFFAIKYVYNELCPVARENTRLFVTIVDL